jgi:CheY-like chemotaxis protein
MKGLDRYAAWEFLLHQAHELAERTRERLRDLQRRYHLPDLADAELEGSSPDLTATSMSLRPPAGEAMDQEHGWIRTEPSSRNSRGLHLMQEIYLKSLGPGPLENAGSDWGIPITHFPGVVGRHPECAARIDHPLISRQHCSFFLEDDQVMVVDLGSRNGTRLNGKWLREPRPVHAGDRLELAGLPFKIRLPVSPATAVVVPEDTVRKSQSAGPHHHVLVVEDNPGAAAVLAELLQHWGHEVRVAHDGLEALRAAEADPPDTVLLDICLPGMDGYQVAQELRSQPNLEKARVVAMTGYGPAEDERLDEKTFDRVLTKPLDSHTLKEVLGHDS